MQTGKQQIKSPAASDLLDVDSLGTLGAVGLDVKLYCLSVVQCLEAVLNDLGKVYEYILSVGGGDESVSLLGIEPLYCTLHS